MVTVPIIALSFGIVSHVAILANILVVPFVPLAMLLTFLCGLAALVSSPFATILAVPTSWLLGYMVNVASFVADLEWAQSDVPKALAYGLRMHSLLSPLAGGCGIRLSMILEVDRRCAYETGVWFCNLTEGAREQFLGRRQQRYRQ